MDQKAQWEVITDKFFADYHQSEQLSGGCVCDTEGIDSACEKYLEQCSEDESLDKDQIAVALYQVLNDDRIDVADVCVSMLKEYGGIGDDFDLTSASGVEFFLDAIGRAREHDMYIKAVNEAFLDATDRLQLDTMKMLDWRGADPSYNNYEPWYLARDAASSDSEIRQEVVEYLNSVGGEPASLHNNNSLDVM